MENEKLKKELLEGNQLEEEENQEEQMMTAAPLENNPADDATSTSEENEEISNPFDSVAEKVVEPKPEAQPVLNNEALEDGVSEEPSTLEPAQPIIEENGAVESSYKMFTQDDVDKLVGDTRVKTREKTFRYIYDRYGVKNEEELDALMANAQRYDTQKEMYDNDKASWAQERDENSKKLADMSEQIALMQSEIDPARYEDAKLILKGKGMEVTLENIQAEIETHPEWKKEEEKASETPNPTPVPEKPTMRIKALGNEQKPAPEMSEEEQAQKLFKLKW